ncbi:MAG: NAD(P)H-dependent oxidoreductase [Mogibacterium sp.]|nr:NAD(P)H-dependent oxidoreductase [Mogibacterium sp.]
MKRAGKEQNRLIVIRPICELQGRTERLESVLGPVLGKLESEGTEVVLVEKVSELDTISLCGQKVLFAICLSEAGVNMEYYRLLEGFRQYPDCLEGAVGGIIVDGSSELYTKALARRLAFSANLAGCTFPGKPLVEATGSLGNFHVLSGIRGVEPYEVYRQQVEELARKVLDFRWPETAETGEDKLRVLVIHASSRLTSNSLLLWDKVRRNLADRAEIHEISLRNGDLTDCRGCRYEDCLHFGESDGCFYGGIMTEQVYPAILECDALVMICPNYNDAVGANLTAFINRLTALFRTHDFSKKRVYALVISGYSGGDIVAEQVIGALNFNKAFILPGRFCMVETANDPKSILRIERIDDKAAAFAERIR